jgi:hypothetical protein
MGYAKLRSATSACLVLAHLTTAAHGQGTFRNLDFESATVPYTPDAGGFLPATNVFPAWTAYFGANQATQVLYNGISLGGVMASLVTQYTTNNGLYPGNHVIGGRFTAVLSAGSDFSGGPSPAPAAIAQSGLTPAGALSLRFAASALVGDLAISLDGVNIPFFALAAGSNYVTYGGDISALAGLTGELRFTEQPISSPFSTIFLDSIQFSDQPIPEPGVVALSALGAVLLTGHLMRRRRRA